MDLLIVPGGAAGKRLDSRAEAKVLRASCESHDRSVLMAADPDDLPARLAAAAGLPGEPHLAIDPLRPHHLGRPAPWLRGARISL